MEQDGDQAFSVKLVALGQIGGIKAKKALEESLAPEKSEAVRREISSALDKIQLSV